MFNPKTEFSKELPETDIKNIAKRTYQLGFIVIVCAVCIAMHFCYIGIAGSACLVFAFAAALGVVLYLNYRGIIRKPQLSIVILVNLLLVGTAILEGARTGQFLFMFPMLTVLPCIVDLKDRAYRNLIIYYSITILSYITIIVVVYNFKPLQQISAALYHQVFFQNMMSAFGLTVIFSFAFSYFEHRYLNRLHEAQHKAVASRTRFLSTMGHELRTPLNGIIGAVNLLLEEGKISESNEYFQIIKHCSDHMLQQVNDILDFNQIEADKLEMRTVKVNLKSLLDRAILPFYNHFEQKNLQLHAHIDSMLDLNLWADDIRLVQILNNLLSNALKYTIEGQVELNIEVKEAGSQTMRVLFSVKDTGIGIDEEDQKKVFEGYWRVYDPSTRYVNGTGLGLAICIKLLKLMGSSLKLVSRKGEGSEFSFEVTFNKYIDTAIQPAQQQSQGLTSLSGIRVLLVEDNPINIMIATKVLSALKATYTTATNGQEALDSLAQDARYDVVLLDLEMPVLSGYDTIGPLTQLYPRIPVLAFTASLVDQHMLAALLARGFADVILKPFQPHQLLAQIERQVRSSKSQVLSTVNN